MECLKENQGRKSGGCVCNTQLAITTLVSQSPCYDGETTCASESLQNTSHTAHSPRRDPSNIQQVVPDGSSLIRENLEDKNLSTAAQDIIMASWRKGTTKQYRLYLLRWTDFCQRENLSPYTRSL